MKKLNKNQWLAIFYIIFGLVLLFLTSKIKYMFSIAAEDVGPKFFPNCCAVGLMLCGLGKFLSSKDNAGKPFLDKKGWIRAAFIVLVMAAYIFGLTYLGYILSTLVLLCVLPYLLCGTDQKPSIWAVLIFSVAMTAITYGAFVYLMNVMLPTGTWTKAILKMLR